MLEIIGYTDCKMENNGGFMYYHVQSAVVIGIEGVPITIEVKLTNGLPSLHLVGLPDATVKEAKERVRSALESVGVRLPAKRITINLYPAEVRKRGAHLDLGMAAALLFAMGELPSQEGSMGFLGQLSLNGDILPVDGILPLVANFKDQGIDHVFVHPDNVEEAILVPGVRVIPCEDLATLISLLQNDLMSLPTQQTLLGDTASTGAIQDSLQPDQTFSCFSEVLGQEAAKRAALIAAAGWHNLLMVGSPGSGKTMIAERLPTILPPMTYDERLELTKIHSIAGLAKGKSLLQMRPFRNPHHSITPVSLAGGGAPPRPGEMSLANGGILFLDELPEYRKNALESLREPLESHEVRHTRIGRSVRYPADFIFVAAMNPCRCGWSGDRERQCRCSPFDVKRYRGKVSGPILDRFDLLVEMPRVNFRSKLEGGLRSVDMAGRVKRAVEVQLKRQGCLNGRLRPGQLEEVVRLEAQAQTFLHEAITQLKLSARARGRILRVARTIGDLQGSDGVEVDHIAEAIQFRLLEKRMQER